MNKKRRVGILAVVLLLLPAVANAALVWDKTPGDPPAVVDEGGDTTWQDGGTANWVDTAPDPDVNVAWSNASPTVAQFGNTAATNAYTITVGEGGVTATGITLLRRYSLQGGPITLAGTAPIISMPETATGTSTVTISSNLVVTDGDSGTADDLVIQGAYPAFSSSYSYFTLSGTSTYSGKMQIQNGAYVMCKTPAALSGTGVVVQAGSTLQLYPTVPASSGAGMTVSLSGYGFGSSGAVHNSRGALMLRDSDWEGSVVLAADSTIAPVSTGRTISGVISGDYAMIRTGTQVLTLTNSNTYTGNTEIRRGGLDLNSAVGPAVNKNGGNLVFRADLDGTAAVVNIKQDEQIGDGAEIRFLCGITNYQTVNLLGNTETVKGLDKTTAASISAYIQNEAAELNGDLILDTAGSDFSFNGVLRDGSAAGQGTLSLLKKGLGTQTLAGANTYSGDTLIKAGKLSVTGSITSDVTVEGGALMGTGTVTANVEALVDGHVAPGASVGTLTVTGDVDLGGTLDVEYDSTTDEIDMLAVSGQLDLSGGILSLSDIGPAPQIPLDQEAYVFATYGSLVGSFASVENLPTGYTVDYTYGEANNQVALVPVPEPAAIALLMGLALALAGSRIRSRA